MMPSGTQQAALVVMRVALGWHLFLQGYGKQIAPSWSAKGYLAGATGPFASWFHAMAANPWWVGVADHGTVWGLMVVGGLLLVGACTRAAALAGAALLLSFYLAAVPSLAGPLPASAEGTEWIVNKLLVEVVALLVIASFPTGRMAGLDAWWGGRR